MGPFSGAVVSVDLHVFLKEGKKTEQFNTHGNKRTARRLEIRSGGGEGEDHASAPGHVADFKIRGKGQTHITEITRPILRALLPDPQLNLDLKLALTEDLLRTNLIYVLGFTPNQDRQRR